jgi:outer membrane receptor protein involved in Fe transport
VFGLNTLGGALSITTKNGRTHQGGGIETSYGSWDRKTAAGEFGGVSKDGSVDYFIAGNYFDEDGWRDASPSKVKQIFSKLGWQNDTSRLELSYTGADNNMIGNGLIQEELINGLNSRKVINTSPDQTENTLSFFNLNGSHFINDATQLTANTYYRKSKRATLNGDVNDDFDEDGYYAGLDGDDDEVSPADLAIALAACVPGANDNVAEKACSGALNTSNTKQKGYGFNSQLAFNQPLMNKPNQFIIGGGYDESKTKFTQETVMGRITAARSVSSIGVENDEAEVNLHGTTKSYNLFATDTLSLNDYVHVTASGRYNHFNVYNKDQMTENDGTNASLTGNHSFRRFSPAVGLSFTPNKDLSVYGSYNEGMRAPTSMELGCANPDAPCKLPNSMAGDPPLEKIVSKTFEAGVRGNLNQDIKWTTAIYRTENHNDIQFIAAANPTLGYFSNVGKTRRQGLDAGLAGNAGKFSWNAGYSYLKATYQTPFEITAEGNSEADNGEIDVNKGDRLPNLPSHAFKLRMQYAMMPNWTVGSNVNAFSSVYMRGNENNAHDGTQNEELEAVLASGKVKGYAVVNMDTRYKFNNSGWQVFAKASNIFNKKYATGGMLGENWFGVDGGVASFSGNAEGDRQLMVGAPRAAWIGMRYDFGKPVATAANVDAD